MGKYLIISLLILFCVTDINAQKADDIIGKYRLPNKLEVEIFKQNDKYFGKIIKLNNFENGQIRDIKNPEPSKTTDLLIGKVIIKDLEFDYDNKQWINGTMYGAEKGMYFDLQITEYRKNEIEVVGSKYFFWKTLVWVKI